MQRETTPIEERRNTRQTNKNLSFSSFKEKCIILTRIDNFFYFLLEIKMFANLNLFLTNILVIFFLRKGNWFFFSPEHFLNFWIESKVGEKKCCEKGLFLNWRRIKWWKKNVSIKRSDGWGGGGGVKLAWYVLWPCKTIFLGKHLTSWVELLNTQVPVWLLDPEFSFLMSF